MTTEPVTPPALPPGCVDFNALHRAALAAEQTPTPKAAKAARTPAPASGHE